MGEWGEYHEISWQNLGLFGKYYTLFSWILSVSAQLKNKGFEKQWIFIKFF